MLDESIMIHSGARRSTMMERIPDLAKIILKQYEVRPGDILLVISNSGVNPLPVQMVLDAKSMGLYVAALTSRATAAVAPKRHKSKKTIVELSDLVLDNMALQVMPCSQSETIKSAHCLQSAEPSFSSVSLLW